MSNHGHRKTHCIHGHEFTFKNTYITPAGAQSCRRCSSHRMFKRRIDAKMKRAQIREEIESTKMRTIAGVELGPNLYVQVSLGKVAIQ